MYTHLGQVRIGWIPLPKLPLVLLAEHLELVQLLGGRRRVHVLDGGFEVAHQPANLARTDDRLIVSHAYLDLVVAEDTLNKKGKRVEPVVFEIHRGETQTLDCVDAACGLQDQQILEVADCRGRVAEAADLLETSVLEWHHLRGLLVDLFQEGSNRLLHGGPETHANWYRCDGRPEPYQ